MKFRDLWLSLDRVERQRLADNAGTTYKYLQKLSGYFGTPSLRLVSQLKRHYPKLSFDGFLPEADTRRHPEKKKRRPNFTS